MSKSIENTNHSWQIPEYVSYEFKGKLNPYCICVFVINEGEKLLNQLKAMKPYTKKVDIVVADGGSTDGSTEISRLESLGVNTLLVKTGLGKLGSQMRMAFAWALHRGYQGVITIDGNGKDGIEGIDRFIEALESGYDYVQGSRFLPGGYSENLPLMRWLGLKLVHIPLMRKASGFRYTDTTNGFRAYSASLLQDPLIGIFRHIFEGYELHYYLAKEAAIRNYQVTEVPVSRKYPLKGPTPTKISPLRGNVNVMLKLFSVVLGKYDMDSPEINHDIYDEYASK